LGPTDLYSSRYASLISYDLIRSVPEGSTVPWLSTIQFITENNYHAYSGIVVSLRTATTIKQLCQRTRNEFLKVQNVITAVYNQHWKSIYK